MTLLKDISVKDKQLLYAYEELITAKAMYEEIRNPYSSYSKGFYAGIQFSEDILWQRVKKIREV